MAATLTGEQLNEEEEHAVSQTATQERGGQVLDRPIQVRALLYTYAFVRPCLIVSQIQRADVLLIVKAGRNGIIAYVHSTALLRCTMMCFKLDVFE